MLKQRYLMDFFQWRWALLHPIGAFTGSSFPTFHYSVARRESITYPSTTGTDVSYHHRWLHSQAHHGVRCTEPLGQG